MKDVLFAKRASDDETVYDFFTRRMSQEVNNPLYNRKDDSARFRVAVMIHCCKAYMYCRIPQLL